MQEKLYLLSFAAIPLLFGITVHEAAHAFAAKRYGDDTAWRCGRLSLNPIKHIDMIGTIIVPIALVLSVGIFFGWAKPVPVTVNKLRNPKRHMIYVALAGPLANFCMLFFWWCVLFIAADWQAHTLAARFAVSMAFVGLWTNLLLGVLNLLPIPPLDGGTVVCNVLPQRFATVVRSVEPFGVVIVGVLVWLGLLQWLPLQQIIVSLTHFAL